MKKFGILLFAVLCLTGCHDASKEIEKGMELRTKLLQASSVEFDVDITADYVEMIHTFSMTCKGDSKGDVTFVVSAPESISGITGKLSGEGGLLTFDDVALHIELLADDQLTPISAPWIMLKTLRSGYLTSAGMEEDLLRLTINDDYEDDALQLDIWLDQQNLPNQAEILYDGYRILSLHVKNMVIS